MMVKFNSVSARCCTSRQRSRRGPCGEITLVGDRLDEVDLLGPIERVNGQSDCPGCWRSARLGGSRVLIERGDGRQDDLLVQVERGDSLAHQMALTLGNPEIDRH